MLCRKGLDRTEIPVQFQEQPAGCFRKAVHCCRLSDLPAASELALFRVCRLDGETTVSQSFHPGSPCLLTISGSSRSLMLRLRLLMYSTGISLRLAIPVTLQYVVWEIQCANTMIRLALTTAFREKAGESAAVK